MNDQTKTREQLIAELAELRQRVADQEARLAQSQGAEANQRGIQNSPATAGLDSVTEQQRAEEDSRRSETKWRSVVGNTPIFVAILDQADKIQFLNHAAPGMSVEEAIGKSTYDFLQPEHVATAKKAIDKVRRTGKTAFYETVGAGPHGGLSWYETHVGPVIVDDEIVAVSLISNDITKRKQAEAALQESERRLSTLMSNLPGVAYRCRNDPDWTMEFVSEGCSRLTGYQASELTASRKIAYGEIIHPDDRRAVSDEVQQALAERRTFQLEYRLRTAQGEEKWVWEQGAGVFSAAGEIQAIEGFITDITDRKHAEAERQHANERLEQRVRERTAELVQANEQLSAEVEQRRRAEEELDIFRRFAEASGQGFGMADPGGYITYVNPTLFRWSDEQKPQDCIGKPLSAYMPTDYRKRRDKEILPSLRAKGYWQGEETISLRDGRTIPTIFTVFPVQDESGNLLRTAVVITDITELKQAQEALRESEAKYRALVESCPDAVAVVDLQGRIAFASQRTAEQHGVLHPDELLGTPAANLVVEAERDRFRYGSRLLIEQGVRRNDYYTGVRKDGTKFDAELSSALIRDAAGNPEKLMGVYRDITQRKRAEEAMRQALDQLETIYDGIIEGLLITDIETKRFVRVNASFCKMLGYTEEELLAASIKDIHPPEEVPNDLRRFQAAAEGRVSINEDRPVLRKDGSIFYADITGHPISYDERPCLLALFRDVTERKQAEEKLQREQRALRRMVLASDRERHLITYELHDGVAQQLLGAMMHFQSQELPKARKSKATGDAYRDGMDALRHAASELRRVMNWLRTPVLDKFGLAEAIEDVAAQLRLTPGAPDIEYRHAVKFQRLEPTLENSLFRIAQEAMTNACRHSKSDKVRVKLRQKGDEVTLEVRDWGIGFDPDTVAENRFGLEGVRERSRILGGNLSIKSKLGQGTVVRVMFPVIEPAD